MSNRPVGMWMLPAYVGASRSTLTRLQREFAVIRALEHPHIARLNELGCNGKQYYVTGERLDGETLRDVLTHLLPERLDVGEADDIVRAVGAALVYAHERGVAHGDVRAENVVVTMDRRVVLTNFLARRVAKVAARPPHPADDVRGLARLAAELYTGVPSTQALRTAAQRGIPAARLNAIRAELDAPPNRRKTSVADFLEVAGLPAPRNRPLSRRPGAGPTVRPAPAAPQRASRSWSPWRIAFPAAALLAIGAFVVSQKSGPAEWRESAAELQQRGADALREMTGRVATPKSGARTVVLDASESPAANAPPGEAAETADDAESAAPMAAAHGSDDSVETPPEQPVAPDPGSTGAPGSGPPGEVPEPAARRMPAASAPAVAQHGGEPPELSFGAPRITVREDHAVVALEVLRHGDPSREAAVGWWVTPDTAHKEEDYADLGRQTLTFREGATSARVVIPLVNDGVREADEIFTVHLGRPHGGGAGAVMNARVTLHDDD